MGFKRKRAADDSPASVSSFSPSTPEAQSPTPLPHDHDSAMDLTISSRFSFSPSRWGFPSSRLGSSDLGSRTRKRFRDNRPEERVIHETTIQKLFNAQRTHPHAEPILSSPHPQYSTQPAPPVQKSTLHSFWKLPTPPVQAPLFQAQQQPQQHVWNGPRCEDCDVQLRGDGDGMDVDMDVDMDMGGGATSQFGCNDCGKNVCGTCAVVSMTRHCLSCATTGRQSRRWW
ncbi:hypothetical protein P154DRAFT_522734 [Amniculicola lignicola CBS 123094]|uniref:Uncharacterized protein n=1 Tax=Amniculicola lignicola CBS 123094 TaxID=1392246 RepID=A0A6A5WJC2_9PLEO|nr:hypothetical protein P154DRAFT_522734 [Amniculicola lignicola CBS 123094]